VNVFLVTRTADPNDPRFSSNYLFNQFSKITPGKWETVSIPLSLFQSQNRGAKPLEESVPFKLIFTSTEPNRLLLVDRIWVTRGGSGQVEVRDAE
jgi:hypothetical protein